MGGGVSEENFYSPRIFKVHDFYENYEIDLWRLDYLFERDVLDARTLQNIHFDLGNQNILVYDRNTKIEHQVNFYNANELKIDAPIMILWNDGIPEFSKTEVNDYRLH